ncbi:centrosomal protein of 295 kDa [Morone saxatilis]|uniref:centrosomal protein of 295 kDa n=1 Tax=Morone saxatilis TaxID=34816 RepID=UPI0015E257F0|nr:centrosomal protein of 295 kDa [Morone saxatilis]
MKRKVSQLRLSPNEEARLIREEHERRRKLRIQQVREQQRYFALQIRREVEQRRQRELEQLGEELREDWERQQREKLHTLQKLYQESLQLLGQGHRSAKENEPDLAAIAQRKEENHTKAEERFREALIELKSQRLKDHERQSRSINARRKALQAEKERSAKVASLPPPPPNPIQNIDSKKPQVVKKSDVSAFAATHYHMPESTVDREVDTNQPNAHEGAELELRRLQDLQKEEMRRREEQLEKAHLRGKQALRREHLVQDRNRLLNELEHMQQTDLLRRRQQVSQMPPQIFQPLCKRQETREDFQREMEFAFEDMYTGERRVKGDLVIQLVPEPLPALSTGSQDQELDVTLDEVPTPGTEDTQQEARITEQETSAEAEPSRPAPRRALRKLLDRIRSQRTQWTDSKSRVSAADSQTAITDQIPERDTTIDTGSLTSEEKLSSTERLEPAHSPPALERTERSTAADTLLPDVLANRIQEFTEERRKREEELEREKQQQVVLLQELEEQKAKLEQMLLEAQQEREHLKAAVTQEVPVNQPEVPVHDQEVTSVTSVTSSLATELVPPPGEDDHTRRIREYQQRLLEQNRIHQRSVEVARQRLEEYQRALQIRYNMTATTLLPPGLIHSPLHSTRPVHLPTSLQLPTTPAVPAYNHAKPQTSEVPTRESNMLASLLHLPGSSLRVRSRLLPDEVESISNSPRNQRPDVTPWLTDNIMERVTEHLPEGVRPFLATKEPVPYKQFTTHHPASIPLQPTSDPIQVISSRITDGAPLVLGRAAVRLQGSLQTESLSSREDDMERQRRELLEVQRREVQRREIQRRELLEVQRRELQEVQRRELQEVQRRVLEQREAVMLQQRQQEEERKRQEVEMEQMRRQKEALQALIHTDAQPQPVPEAASEVLVSDNGQTRLKLLACLLKAIEETNGGTLSHLEDPQENDGSPQPPSNSSETDPISQSNVPAGPSPSFVLPSALLPPPRAGKPPVTRVRLGVMELMTEQHELSAIQEVESPGNTSQVTGLDETMKVPSHTADWDPQEESESSVASDATLQTPSWSSSGQQTVERLTDHERRLMRAGTSPESSQSDSVLRIMSPLSSDSGRGADYSGPAITSYRSPTESACRPPDFDCLSSTTISTGSYVTTDPEQNVNTVKSPDLRRCVEPGQGADCLNVSSPSSQSSSIKDSSGCRSGAAVGDLFNDSSIQRIIDKYTKELNISLSTTGKTTDSEGSYVDEPDPSVPLQSLVRAPERREDNESSSARQSLPSDTAGTHRTDLEWDNKVNPVLEHLSGEDPSLAEDSFRPLIGQLADQSSCLAADHRDLAMEQLVGQPSAHSSLIGQLPGLPVSVSLDQAGWDSTLSRMIGRLSHQSSSHWLSGGRDFYAGQLMAQMASEQSTTWLEEGPEGSRMRPLVGELDESAGQHSGSSGERTHVDLGVSTEASVQSYPALPPEASSHSSSVPGVSPHAQDQTLQSQTSLMDLGPERSEVFPSSDSFHPLLAEVTHNETADACMTFHLPVHDVPNSPEGQSASWERSVSTTSEEFETPDGPSVESEPSPERLRTEEPSSCVTASHALHESASQLITSQYHPQESDVEITAQSLSNLTLCDDASTPSMPQTDVGDRSCISERHEVPFSDLCVGELKSEQGSNLRSAVPNSEEILEAASEKGILEQSDITLVSLTDTTLQDQETTTTDEEGVWEDQHPDVVVVEEGQKGQETEGSESTLLQDETPQDKDQTDAVMLLEFQWGPIRATREVNQQKRTALLQRSSRRVEDIKARRALAKMLPESRAPSEAGEQSEAKGSQPVTCKAKTKSEPQHNINTKSKGGQTQQQQTTDKSGFIKQKKTQLPPPVSESRLKRVDEMKICPPEKRKLDVTEMHQRTQRLYERLEEVKHQKAIRSRQEAYAKNRLKAKEFHMKTLQKLRTKQTPQ